MGLLRKRLLPMVLSFIMVAVASCVGCRWLCRPHTQIGIFIEIPFGAVCVCMYVCMYVWACSANGY